MRVRLSPHEVRQVAHVGVERRVAGLARQDRHGMTGPGWDQDIEGAAAEYAVAKVLNRFWLAVAADLDILAGDVGQLQVRSTERATGCLIVHRDDDPSQAFILVTGRVPLLTLRGWLWGREAQRTRWWRTEGVRSPAFFVPQGHLRSMPTALEAAA